LGTALNWILIGHFTWTPAYSFSSCCTALRQSSDG
jgi:hypothetical protein